MHNILKELIKKEKVTFASMDDEHIYKRHNKTLLLYLIVLPIKYCRKVITDVIGKSLKSIYMEISERYEINFIEISYKEDHVHFLLVSGKHPIKFPF